jgi:hypothetical protein
MWECACGVSPQRLYRAPARGFAIRAAASQNPIKCHIKLPVPLTAAVQAAVPVKFHDKFPGPFTAAVQAAFQGFPG